MKQSTCSVLGHRVVRFEFPPLGEQKGTLFHAHGQGDYAERYGEILEPFRESGLRVVCYDAPGHGQSSGRRGAIPYFEFYKETYKLEQRSSAGPFGLSGHSMGGLVALSLLGDMKRPHFAWLSSPLIDPILNQPRVKVWLASRLASLLPEVTVSTGVTPDACSAGPRPEQTWFHSRISLGWANQLLTLSHQIHSDSFHLPSDIPILFTQGTEDTICPLSALQPFLEEKHTERTQLSLVEGALHEPFSGETRNLLYESLGVWIEKEINSL